MNSIQIKYFTVLPLGLFKLVIFCAGIVGSRQEQNEPGTSGNSSRSYVTPRSNVCAKEKLSAPSKQPSEHCPSLEPCSLSLLSSRLLDISSDSGHQVISEASFKYFTLLEPLATVVALCLCAYSAVSVKQNKALTTLIAIGVLSKSQMKFGG